MTLTSRRVALSPSAVRAHSSHTAYAECSSLLIIHKNPLPPHNPTPHFFKNPMREAVQFHEHFSRKNPKNSQLNICDSVWCESDFVQAVYNLKPVSHSKPKRSNYHTSIFTNRVQGPIGISPSQGRFPSINPVKRSLL